MKYNMVPLGYRCTPDYPYNYRVELVEFSKEELNQLDMWLRDANIPHTRVGWPGVVYLHQQDAPVFALRWSQCPIP